MRCPKCNENYTKQYVVDSRDKRDGSVRRRRECSTCLFRYTTFEHIEGTIVKAINERELALKKIRASTRNYISEIKNVLSKQQER